MTIVASDTDIDDRAVAAVKRNGIINIRVSETEKHTISTRADKAHLSISSYMRHCAMNGSHSGGDANAVALPVSKETERKQVAIILARMAIIMDKIRGEEHTPFLDELSRHILTLRDECFETLGKKP